ncbi:MAG: hypothetical protein HDR47_06005 [Bacteroides sp.]|nr:hypothetical protein [Bacteroides sp.]
MKLIRLLIIGFALLSSTVPTSCKSDSIDLQSDVDVKPAEDFSETLKSSIDSMMESIVVVDNYNYNCDSGIKKTASVQSNSQVTSVVADMEFVEPSKNINTSSIRTLGDMYEMQTVYGVDFHVMENTPVGMQHVIWVSDEKTLEALMPLIDQSKRYLYKKGFTDQEINEMLEEENASPAALVPLVLLLSEDDINSQRDIDNLVEGCQTFSTRGDITLSSFIGCAIVATGLDIVNILSEDINKSSVNRWTKKAVKYLFKKVASRFFGPVGVAIMVLSFSGCLAQVYAS